MRPILQVFQDVGKQYRWRLVAANGEVVAQSEAYTKHSDALDAARSVKRWALLAKVKV